MGIGTTTRRRPALGVISMALALGAAAFVGSSMGYIWGLFSSGDEEETQQHQANVAAPGS